MKTGIGGILIETVFGSFGCGTTGDKELVFVVVKGFFTGLKYHDQFITLFCTCFEH